jgi:serine/threonine protein kinase
LKIADFGLATSGEWIYQESYRSSCRKDLLKKYHKSIIGDGEEKPRESGTNLPSHNNQTILNHERLKRMHVDSVVGTYYYMAPEVLQGGSYNATADWY